MVICMLYEKIEGYPCLMQKITNAQPDLQLINNCEEFNFFSRSRALNLWFTTFLFPWQTGNHVQLYPRHADKTIKTTVFVV